MCGRYTNTANLEALQLRFDLETGDIEFQPRYNIAPTQVVPIILEEEGKRKLVMMKWGLIPTWAKGSSIGNKMINARNETLAEKPAFKRLFQKRRCIVPADGFFEWKKTGSTKQPMRIVLKSDHFFASSFSKLLASKCTPLTLSAPRVFSSNLRAIGIFPSRQ